MWGISLTRLDACDSAAICSQTALVGELAGEVALAPCGHNEEPARKEEEGMKVNAQRSAIPHNV